jgi:hypothetical protein
MHGSVMQSMALIIDVPSLAHWTKTISTLDYVIGAASTYGMVSVLAMCIPYVSVTRMMIFTLMIES